MQSKILATFVCSAVVASCVFADISQGSAPKNATLTELSKVSAATKAPFAELAKSGATTSLPFTELSNGSELNSRALPSFPRSASQIRLKMGGGSLSEFATSEFTLLAQNTAAKGFQAPSDKIQSSENFQAAQLPKIQSGANSQASEILLAANENARSIGATRHDPRFTQDFPQDIPQAYQLGAVEVTAPKFVDYNPSVTSIDTKAIKDKNADNLAQAVRMAPGVLMHEATGRRGEPSISIRGYGGTQVGFFLDGIPMMSIYDKQTDFGQYVTQGIDSIHIVKGFTSPVYGMSVMGGAINIVSAKPQKELEVNFHQRLIVGRKSSPDEIRQGFGIGTNQGSYYFQADISHTNREQYPLSSDFKPTIIQPSHNKINSYYKNITAKLKAGVQNENHEYSLNFIYQRGEKGGLYSDDGGGPWWDWTHYDKKTLYLLGTSFFSPNFSLNTRLYYDNFFNILNGDGTRCLKADGTKSSAGYCQTGSLYDDDTIGAILTFDYVPFESGDLKFGINTKRDKHLEKDATTKLIDTELRELNTSFFAQYAQRLGIFRAVVAGNYDIIYPLNVDFNDGNGNVRDKQPEIDNGFSLQGILYLDISDAQSVHFTLGAKDNLPTLKQRYSSKWGAHVPNPGLEIESAINYEVGYDLSFGSTAVSVAAFYNDMRNMFVEKTLISTKTQSEAQAICPVPDNPRNRGTYYCYQNVNAKSGYTYGGELSVEQGFFANDLLVLGANYSYIQKRAKGVGLDDYDGADGKKILDYPNHIANAKIAIRPLRNLEFIALGTLESARYYADGNGGYVKGANYYSVDLSARYELVRGFNVSVGVTNLTDRDNYSGYLGESYHFAGRQWFVGVDYRY